MKGIVRPPAVVVSKKALVPEGNFIQPPPNQFTHELKRRQPFYFARGGRKKTADGHFAAGTKVLLLVSEGGDFCRVADGRGVYAEVRCDSLKKL
ncbi:MAG TPA: hypothetical protein VFX96_09195 [Pyrinomonadaceae bacterium]|nr:hypothetical protein [Pyrinomonadaceae bacterium]